MCTIVAMSESHAPTVVEGYRACRCSRLVRDEVARRTQGRCPDCFIADGGDRVTKIELVGKGRRVSVPLNRRKPQTPRKRTAEAVARRKQADKAKERARKRLASMFPDVYDMLVAEERAALGLEPWPTDTALRGGDPEIELGFAEMMSELADAGVTVE